MNQRLLWLVRWVLLSAVVLLTACGGGADQFGGGGGGTTITNPNFKDQFLGINSEDRLFALFLPKRDTTNDPPTGTFGDSAALTVSVAGDIGETTRHDVTGSFNQASFNFTTTDTSERYTGRFLDADSIELTRPNGGTVVLTRDVNEGFKPHVSSVWTFASAPTDLLQLWPAGTSSDNDVSLLLQGVEFKDGQTSTITGSASVSRMTLRIARASGVVTLQGRYRARTAGAADLIDMNDGSQLLRGGMPDPQRALFAVTNGFVRTLIDVDSKGLDRRFITGVGTSISDFQRFFASPDGSKIAVIATDLFIVDRASKVVTPITSVAQAGGQVLDVAWAPGGGAIAYITFDSSSQGSTVYLRSLSPGATASPVTSSTVRSTTNLSRYRIGFSASGTFVAFTTNLQPTGDAFGLFAVTSSGNVQKQVWPLEDNVEDFVWSPTGTRIAYRTTAARELWTDDVAAIFAPAGAPSPRLKSQEAETYVWSANGASLAYVTSSGGLMNAWKNDPETNQSTRLTPTPYTSLAPYLSWAPDNIRVAYLPLSNANGWVISDGAERTLTDTNALACNNSYPSFAWSPAATKAAYLASSSGGGCELVVLDLGTMQRRAVSQEVQAPFADPAVRWLSDGLRIAVAVPSTIGFGNDLWVAYVTGSVALKISDRIDGEDVLDTELVYQLR
jgi:Tol biopolymer transport system component